MGTKYDNAQMRICRTGGAAIATISTSDGTGYTGRGNEGVSLPCKGCYITSRSTNNKSIRLNIGAAATSALGIEIARYTDQTNNLGILPFFILISDVAQLYFYSADTGDVVDILYLAG